jgi:DNA repair exonuclease SbcCD ATPase subunit
MSETPWNPGPSDTSDAADTSDFAPITSQQEFEKRIKGRLSQVQKKFSDYEDLKSFASEAQTKIADLTKELETERFNSVRNQIAADKGVPAHRINGSTPEELAASAEEYLAEIADIAKPKAKTPLKSGATATGNQVDPKDKAALMLQQMFGMGGNPIS